MSEPKFVHLHVHSDYSIVEGLVKPKDLVKRSVLLNMPAIAITDYCNLYGVIEFYNTAHQLGVKPIIGTTVKFYSNFLKNDIVELTLLASNQEGYKNLMILISHAYRKGYKSYFDITIEKTWLSEFNRGLIALSGGIKGEIGKMLLRGEHACIYDCLSFYKKYFPESYYLELCRTNRENEEIYLNLAVNLSESTGIPIVATNDVCFLNKKDFKIHNIKIAIHEGVILEESQLQNDYSQDQFLKNEEDMCNMFTDLPEALLNSVEIAKRCNVFLVSGRYFLPNFDTGKIKVEKYLIIQAHKGLLERFKHGDDKNNRFDMYEKYKNRLDMELSVINTMGFPGYFLIVMEFVKWAKDNNIPVGPGRGSGAGSLVAYALNITEVDPLRFDLVFERFLNPERISLPDFDIDFCMEQRDKVIDHVSNIYGRESVAQIITFGTMTAKAVIRDVGRVLRYPYGFINKLSKLIPSDPGMTLKEAFSQESELSNIYKNNDDVKLLIDISKRLEGTNRNIGKHAGGIVISPTKIVDFCPLYCDEHGKNPVTQFDKNDVEYIGLVKFDFLGLRTLTIIRYAVEMINQTLNRKKKKLIDMNKINLDDKKCFHLLKKAETISVFQLESDGMRDLIKRLQPDCFEDIVALLALFRPGPLQSGMVDNFINRKHGREKISYPDYKWQHILLKPILKSTYGIILYQEQVMQIAQTLSGFTLGKADILRRAISKKNSENMKKQRVFFKKGALKNGIEETLSMKIFDLLEKFAGYGFNRSHSVAYALISYQTLWLKSHYPAQFLSSVMTSEIDNTEKIFTLVKEALRMKITIVPPNINLSKYEFYVHCNTHIVYGLGAIKGLGSNSISLLIQEREKNGKYHDLFDLCMRIDSKKISRRILEKLIMSGSFDCFNKNRSYLLQSIDDAIKVSKESGKYQYFQQESLFGLFQDELSQVKKNNFIHSHNSEKDKLKNEYQVLGFYLTEHPINKYVQELKNYIKIVQLSQLSNLNKIKKVFIFGIIVSVKFKKTKNNNSIAIVILDDNTHRIEVVIFTELLNSHQNLLSLHKLLFVDGVFNTGFIKSSNVKVNANHLMSLQTVRDKYIKKLTIILNLETICSSFLKKVYCLLTKQPIGHIPLYVILNKNITNRKINERKKYFITMTNDFIDQLNQWDQYKNISLIYN